MKSRKVRRLIFIAGGICAGAAFAANVQGDQNSVLIFVTGAVTSFAVAFWAAPNQGGGS